MSLLTRLLVFILAIWAALRLLGMLLRGGGPRRRSSGAEPGARSGSGGGVPVRGRMVRDRVCGTFLPPDRALTLSERGETLYFCGDRCRDAYRSGATPSGGGSEAAREG